MNLITIEKWILVRMLVSEEKEMNAYRKKIHDIWNISKKEGFAKGLMFGTFQFTGMSKRILFVSQ